MSTYDYTTTYDTIDTVSSTAGAVVGGVLLIIGIAVLIGLAVAVCTIIGQWKAFKKAGKGGWEAIIPVYNQIVLCQITGVNPWWILIVFGGSLVLGFLSAIPVIGFLFTLASYALTIYFCVILYVSTARSFGKSDGYAAGLYFLAPIFWLLVGGKNTQYVGPKPMKDVVWNFVEEKILGKGTPGYGSQPQQNNGGFQQPVNNNFQQPVNNAPVNNASVNNDAQAKFCTACGYKVTNGERFCPGCGKEIL